MREGLAEGSLGFGNIGVYRLFGSLRLYLCLLRAGVCLVAGRGRGCGRLQCLIGTVGIPFGVDRDMTIPSHGLIGFLEANYHRSVFGHFHLSFPFYYIPSLFLRRVASVPFLT